MALGLPPSECLVSEEAVPGVRAARRETAVLIVDRLDRLKRFVPHTPVSRLAEAALTAECAAALRPVAVDRQWCPRTVRRAV